MQRIKTIYNFKGYDVVLKFPKSYALNLQRNYPLVFIQDGSYLYKKIEADVIFAGIEPINRNHDYTPWPAEVVDEYCQGQADQYLKMIEALLVSLRAQYRISNDVKDIGICGGSYGGLVSFYALYKRNDLFGKYILLSPSVWYPHFEDWVMTQPVPEGKEIYWYVGQAEGIDHPYIMKNMVPVSMNLVPVMKEKVNKTRKTKLIFQTCSEGTHHPRYFKKYLKKALRHFHWL